MIDREVDWPVWVVLGRSWGLCVRSWVALGGLCLRSGGGLGTYVGDLELLLGLYGRSRVALGASISGLGCTWAALGIYAADLGPLLGLYWRSWAALGAAVCGPGLLLGPMLAVLGRSWNLFGRSGVEKCECAHISSGSTIPRPIGPHKPTIDFFLYRCI